jgi:hypothetical protein
MGGKDFAQGRHRSVKYHVEGRHADLELERCLLACPAFEHTKPDGQSVARMDGPEQALDAVSGDGQVMRFGGGRLTSLALRGVDLALEVCRFE